MTSPASIAERPVSSQSRCAYCEAPLPALADALPSPLSGSRYCCYGCRLLAQAGHKPVETAFLKGSPWFKIAVGAVLAGQAMLLGLAVNLAPPAGLLRGLLHGALLVAALAALAILGKPLLQSALEELRRKRVSIELLFLAGILGALGASLSSTLRNQGAVYYEVVAVLVTVYSVGRTLGAQSRARALAETRHLRRAFDSCRKLNPDGSSAEARVADIRPGDQIRVLPGEPVPIDGRIVSGEAFVCETPLTGEPFPVVRRVGDTVLAGSYSEDGALCIAATVGGGQRQLDRLIAALENARERPSRIQSQADAIVAWFLPLVLSISLGTFFFWLWRENWTTALFNAMAVLLVACPCAMGLATPLALWSGLATLAARGLVVRGGNVLERLAQMDQVVFDKTGTLSEERFSLIDLATLGAPEERERIAAQLGAVQQASPHPVARAFHGSGETPGQLVFRVRSTKTIPALGVEAWIESSQGEEHYLRIGQRGLVSNLESETELLARLRHAGLDHLVYVEVDGALRAIAAVRERVRDSAAQAMALMKARGLACLVMTGDRPDRAAQLIEIPAIEGGLTPENKADRIQQLRESGRQVGFVGDGVNDAPALQAASVGIALAHGAGVTTAGADAVLYGGDLRVLPWAVDLSRRVLGSIRSNLAFAAAYNIVGIALAATGSLHPAAAALLMVVSSFTVSWRALRSVEVTGCCVPLNRDPAAAPANALGPRVVPSRKPELRDAVLGLPSLKWQTAYGWLVIAQAPFLIYLGQLSLGAAFLTSLVMAGLGWFIIRFKTSSAELSRLAAMTFAMLGPGNWGMILGWWADSGFAPAAVGCPHCGQHGFSLLAFASMPWMNLGMLLLGLPPMVFDRTALERGWSRVGLALLSAAGMIWGMGFGSHVAMKWLGSLTSERFLLSFAGMTLGMLLGMFLACELGRALLLRGNRRRSTNAPSAGDASTALSP